MHCPACGFENLTGADSCDNCGAELAGHDLPQPAVTFHSTLLGEHLDALGAPAPLIVSPDTPLDVAVAAMHASGADCVLVMADDRLVGIFTDRDAVVKAAGLKLDSLYVHDFMTPDPVVLRHDDPIAVAIHKMAVGGFRHIPILEDGRPTGVVSARDVFHHLAEGFRLSADRVVVLADDLIWATRLADGVRAAGAEAVPARSAAGLATLLPDVDRVIVDLTARAYDGIDAIAAARAAGRPVLAVGQHDDLALRKRALAAGADRVYAYRKLFEDGPATLAAWIAKEPT